MRELSMLEEISVGGGYDFTGQLTGIQATVANLIGNVASSVISLPLISKDTIKQGAIGIAYSNYQSLTGLVGGLVDDGILSNLPIMNILDSIMNNINR